MSLQAIIVKEEMMKIRWTKCIWIVCAMLCLGILACRSTVTRTTTPAITNDQRPAPTTNVRTDIGFRTRRNLDEHYQKHGREFGGMSQDEYLRQAQILRDSAAGGDILESARNDGVTTRFDRQSGAFLAFNPDLTIRTCFKPNDGERYFKRQLNRER